MSGKRVQSWNITKNSNLTHTKNCKRWWTKTETSRKKPPTYTQLDKNSLDYAIMEKIDPANVRILKADLGWSDIGSFKAIWEELSKSPEQNITRGETKLIGCSGCLIYADNNEPVAGIGLENTNNRQPKRTFSLQQRRQQKESKT